MAQTRTRTFPDGDYPQRLNQLWAAVEMARRDEEKSPPPLLEGELLPSEELAEKYQALKDEADADATAKRRVVTLSGVGRRQWRELREKHPPRTDGDPETVKADRVAGVNTDAIADDLLHASVTSPTFTSRADFDEWLDDWSEGEFQTLLRDAWELSNSAAVDPKSLPASLHQRGGKS